MTELTDFKEELETCFGTSCGFCERGCPVYQVMKVKTLCMKGRNRTMLGLIQGKFGITPAVVQAAFECTLCGNCDRWCSLKRIRGDGTRKRFWMSARIQSLSPSQPTIASRKTVQDLGKP